MGWMQIEPAVVLLYPTFSGGVQNCTFGKQILRLHLLVG
jgi:hypothetical protein